MTKSRKITLIGCLTQLFALMFPCTERESSHFSRMGKGRGLLFLMPAIYKTRDFTPAHFLLSKLGQVMAPDAASDTGLGMS